MKVVFLIPYPVEPWCYLPPHCDDAESGRAATLVNKKYLSQFTWETQRNRAEERVSGARQALRDKNVEVEFDLYTGRLTSAIRDCVARSEFHWILTWEREWFGFSIRKTFVNLFESETTHLRAMYVYQCRYAQ